MTKILKIEGKIVCGEMDGKNVWEVTSVQHPYALWHALSDLYFAGHKKVRITMEAIDD